MKKIPPPKHLSAEARRLWVTLCDEYVIDDAAGLLLVRSALEAFDRLQGARVLLAKEGAVVRDRWGQSKPHPALGVERDAANRMHAALRALKLEPGAFGS